MKKTGAILWVSVSLILVLLLGSPRGFSMETSVEEAILRGNWQEVFEVLEKDSVKANDPVARLLMAHACLATNRNNSSMLLFLSVKEESDLQSWSEWTESLLGRNPQNHAAFYLSADAAARRAKLEEAEEVFSHALEIKEDFALALNGRGVVRVLTNEWDKALIDFYQATMLAPEFADAHANLGTYWILKESPEGALEAFNQALAVNPEFALAYNGRGCAYFGGGEFDNAAMDFATALSLNPVLLVAEINQGLGSAYASQMITFASAMEKKPGTTFESLIQQYPDVLKEQQQQLSEMLPSQKDQEFWKKMDALPWLSNDQLQALAQQHGLQKVQMGAFLKKQELRGQIAENHTKSLALKEDVDCYNRWIIGSSIADLTSSLAFSSPGLTSSMQEGWMPFLKKAGTGIGKGSAEARVHGRTAEVLIPGLLSDPFSSTASSVSKAIRYVGEDKRSAAMVEHSNLVSQTALISTQYRAIEDKIDFLSGIPTVELPKQPPSQIPGYYTSVDRPLTEISALASMVDKGITRPMDGSARRALVVAQDPFRANLQQQELHRYGFETRVVSPTVDIQPEAKRWGADVILGIKRASEIKDPSKQFHDDVKRKVPPPFPPDGFSGGAAGTRAPQIAQPQIKPDWDWGKPFVPTYPKGAPGGISTEELAKSFVDKGNWPVLTSFSLFYQVGTFAEGENDEGGEK